MSIRRNILPFCLAMAAQGYDIRSAGYTQCTGRGNESKPISAGKNKKRPIGQKKLSKKQRRKRYYGY
nr:MAG TPA: hypothetical protein [Caudoviricetes sp.]